MSGSPDETDRLRAALGVIRRLNAEVEQLKAAGDEPIAILGMGCRFPGGADTPQAYWRLLRDGVDATSEIPPDRWDVDGLYDPDPRAAGKISSRRGGFIAEVDRFDADFFGISPREAAALDPQHRILMEVAWEALEHAAMAAGALRGSRTGVFLGICSSDYASLAMADAARVDGQVGTGNAHATAAGRLSFFLGVRGPSLAVDTACSSSLVAVHLACQSLRARECDAALAGGVNLILTPTLSVTFSKAGMLAPDGRCKAFDARADGYGRGEGCGVVVLKRLSDALAGDEPILAVIRGSAVNQDGRSSGLTVPSGPAQAAVICEALRRARLRPDEVDLVEAHGTGTALGDPIEAGALRVAYGEGRAADRPLQVGTAKAAIGHLEGAAGVAGLIKAVLCLQHAAIPGNIHLETLNPRIEPGAALAFPRSLTPWPAGAPRRRAGVSSFGFSGTNAHLILEQAPDLETPPAVSSAPQALLLSARTPAALETLRQRYDLALTEADGIEGLCAASQTGRNHFEHRLAAVGGDTAELRSALLSAKPAASLGRAPRIAFLFTGQGSAFAGMARELYDAFPVARQSLDRSAERLESLLDEALADILASPALLSQTRYAQPAIYALQVALASLWRSWGVRPVAVLGHSLGEFAAAWAAGALRHEDGLKAVVERGRLMQAASADGAMASVFADRREVEAHLAAFGGALALAADNGPRHTVVSGARPDVEAFLAILAAAGLRFRSLEVSTAFHSAAMRPVAAAFSEAAQDAGFEPPTTAFVSTVTGALEADAIAGPDYWMRQITEPTEFGAAMRTLGRLDCDAFVEIGPRPTLTVMGQACLSSRTALWLPSLQETGGRQRLVQSLAELHCLGAPVDWRQVQGEPPPRKQAAPTYPFERARHWLPDAPAAPIPQASSQRLLELLRRDRTQDAIALLEGKTGATIHLLTWRPTEPLDLRTQPQRAGSWLLLSDGSGFADELAVELARRGHQVACAPADDAQAAVAALRARRPCGVIQLHGGGSEPTAKPAQDFLALAQAVLREPGPTRLWGVTRGAYVIDPGDRPAELAAAPVWGLMKSFAVEHPDRFGGAIDLGRPDPADAVRVTDEICSADEDRFVAYRNGRRLAQRLEVLEAPAAAPRPLKPDGLYLVAGGGGSLGLRVAGWLVERGARRLMLLSRHGLTGAEAAAAVTAWRQAGVRVDTPAVDLGDADQMAQLAEVLRTDGPVAGVVHAAGAAVRGDFAELTGSVLDHLLRPKLLGGWRLHRLVADQPLDFFVCFSSIASAWGAKGLAGYAAANQSLDALAHHRRALGLPGVSINWGPWERNVLADAADQAALGRIGVTPISEHDAIAALEQLIAKNAPAQAVAARVDFERLAAVQGAVSSARLFSALVKIPVPPSRRSRPDLVERLTRAPAGERRRIASQVAGEAIARVLGYPPGRALDPRAGFFELGVDSVMALEVRGALEAAFGVELAATVVLDLPNLEALTAHLVDEIFPPVAEPNPAVIRRGPAPASADDSEIAARLSAGIRAAMGDG